MRQHHMTSDTKRSAFPFSWTPSNRAWIWPVRLPQAMQRQLTTALWNLGERMGGTVRWLLAGLLIGGVPVLSAPWCGLAWSQWLSGLLLVPLVLAAALRDWTGRALLVMTSTFAAHGAACIGLFFVVPESLPWVFPAGAAYWRETHLWLVTGVSAEYEPSYWLPAHGKLLGGVCLFAYTSLGFIPFAHGLHQVDLMNAYVSQLLLHARDPWTALVLGWHPWSVLRGLGYLFIIFEVSSLSLSRLLGLPAQPPRRRRGRWLAGAGLLLADAIVKFYALEPVRQMLEENLR